MSELDRELGQIETRLKSLEKRTTQQCEKLDELIEMKHQLEGGKKAVAFLVIIAASIGSAVTYFMQHMTWKF